MDVLLGEHGEAVLYGTIGILMVVIICSVCLERWSGLTPEFKNMTSNNSKEFLEKNSGRFPRIITDEIIFAEFKDENFDSKKYITAIDENGNDITEKMRIYGQVNVLKKGVYSLRCVVVAENHLACTKYVNVIVE